MHSGLAELPLLVDGIEFENYCFCLHPYPGLSTLDTLIIGLQEGTLFPELRCRLKVRGNVSIVEGYVDDD